MEPAPNPRTQQFPAKHAQLEGAVDTAITFLQSWARGQGETWEFLTHADALIFKTLLEGSRPAQERAEARCVRLDEFKTLTQEPLDVRRWEKFLRWYAVEVADGLASLLLERKQPVLFPARVAGSGGRGPRGKAVYFLSLDEPSLLREAREANRTAFLFKPTEPAETEREAPLISENPIEFSHNIPPTSPSQQSSQVGAEGPGETASRPPPPTATDLPNGQLDARVPMAVALSMCRSDASGNSVVWILAILLILFLTTGRSACFPLADEILKVLDSAREAISGGAIVRF